MTIITNTTDRKALVKAIAEDLGTTSTYLRAPTYGYQIGDFMVDRDGNIIGEDFTALQDFLQANGWEIPEQGAPAEDADDAQETEEAPETAEEAPAKEEADLEDGGIHVDRMNISIPAQDATPAQLKNLIFMLHSRQTLLNRMCQSDCLNIPDILIDRLKESTPETAEDFTSLLDDSEAVAGLSGFDFRDGKISMTFPFDETEPTKWTAYANLLSRIYDAAVKATRVSPERVEPDEQNEKYLAHIWLQRLGYHGADFKAERRILLGHLSGYCAFSNGDKMQAHKDKYAALRREQRQTDQEATAEVTTEEVDGND